MKKIISISLFAILLTYCTVPSESNSILDKPTNLNAGCNYVQEVTLSWYYDQIYEVNFLVRRKAEDGVYTVIDTIEAGIYEYCDVNVIAETTYNYMIAAVNANSQSEWSDEVSVHIDPGFQSLNFGTDTTLELVTWNIEHFPKNLDTTLEYAAQIIRGVNADIYALQEIESSTYFNDLIAILNFDDLINTWDGYRATSASYSVNLAYIYKSNILGNTNIYEIYSSSAYSRQFPRRPLVLEMQWNGEEVYVINNHFKALGDGYLDLSDAWDEETRRYDACNLLDEYISQNLPDENVIVLGDLNDRLTDTPSNNVFITFLNATDEYDFTDMEIAEGSSAYWSYPSWPSHLDHILITNELFDEFVLDGSDIQTLCIDDLLDDGWSEYDYTVSDHRPVGLKLAYN